MNKNLLLSGLFIFLSLSLLAQPRPGYYDSAEGRQDAALKTALFNVIRNHSQLSYSDLWVAFHTTDNLNGRVWDMYSDCSFTFGSNNEGGDQCGSNSPTSTCDCYNREHSFPRSWFGGAVAPMNTDLFHLYPTDGYVNGRRGNYPFGEVSGGSVVGTGRVGSARSGLGYSGTVFEPADEYKGDFARSYFYMITRYQDVARNWNSSEAQNMLSGGEYKPWAVNMLLEWHRNDPVSEKETNRNNAVEREQRNRNPFIDYPELVEHIWGSRKGQVWTSTGTGLDDAILEILIVQNPVRDDIQIQSSENNLEYTLYSINGQMLQSGSVQGTGSIYVSDLTDGLYLLQMRSGAKKSVQKIIINRYN